jgi:CheY-like chemotaxis protein
MVATRPCFLAVDDDPGAQLGYKRLLRKYGLAVVAENAAQARLQLASHSGWRAFLFDLRLPDGSGLDLLAYARRTFPATPAMLLTGHVEGHVVNAAYDLDAGVLGKPFDASRVHRWIERVLGLQRDEVADAAQPPALRERIVALRELLGRLPADARTRYDIGRIVAELKARPDAYGHGAVSVAAAALGEDIPSLYRYARVAERWTREELDALLARTMRDGRPLSWSHLVALASVQPGEAYARLVERTLGECLSVRELDEAVDQARAGAR